MAVSVHSPSLPPVGGGAAGPRLWTSVMPWLAVLGLTLAATVIHIQTRPAEPVPPAGTLRSPTPAAPPPAADSAHPMVTAPRTPASLAPPAATRPGQAEPARSGPALPPPPTLLRPPALPPQGEPPRALQGVYGTAPTCPNCGWVESVQAVPAGGLPPGAVLAAGAAVGAQAGAGVAHGTSAGRPNVPAAAAGAVVGASALAGTASGPASAGFEIRIRMEDGSQRQLLQPEPLPLGAAVVLEGGVARLSSARPAAGTSVGTGSANPAATGKTYGTR